MKIVQISSPTFVTPPIDYGGIQREVYYLTNQLVEMGHEVILYGKKGSACKGKVIEYPEDCESLLSFVLETLPEGVDIIHDHKGFVAEAQLNIPTICTSHTTKARKIPSPVYVSKAVLLEKAKGKGEFVHNGLNLDDYPFCRKKDNYLLFLGRINENKGTHFAIEVSKETGIPLIIAGPVQQDGVEYFKEKVQPFIDNKLIRYVGPVGGEQKLNLIKKAKFVLFPITWFEPFGLVPIEAMACGTPAICFRKGGVVETMQGFPELLCDTKKEMIKIIRKNKSPDPQKMRQYVEKHFSINMITRKYLKLYKRTIQTYEKWDKS
ncbi:glycosyltransferase family 4 protein [Bacillus canaveralius]|uniref:Glycosyltransferase family 4 protein n=1 Tax=Bacillus canaveralius TaxID=1403243 RepID=A0A2N5GHP6_9BACI|nr:MULTISPECIES: glycosyltransferase family 4 protein [Bacillus]PLR80326.1 glycosyltransferase family 4 protein [Bacillus canaveralius]PLR85810.1 glycosyltransferase family 4 protein [Bacillus sp. V33-4]PLR95455.1 glycosyltransferase family 4 protein [Bacillus canaveralius]RSK48693.1 glycosyltransferase family 4 protein [Bacillus canaveralius]